MLLLGFRVCGSKSAKSALAFVRSSFGKHALKASQEQPDCKGLTGA